MNDVLVIGASGDQGREQVQVLVQSGRRVRAASRHPKALSAALPAGAEPVFFDFKQPESLLPCLAGVDVVFINWPSASFNDPRSLFALFDQTLTVMEQAPERPRKIIFNSSLYVGEKALGFPAHDTRLRMIERLRSGPIDHVAVCPVIFMDNLLRPWALPAIQNEGVFRYPHDARLEVSWICLRDVARIMLACAGNDSLRGETLVVGGPETLRGPDVAAILSTTLGRSITFESEPTEAFAQRMGALFSRRTGQSVARTARDLARIYDWYNTSPVHPFKVDMDPTSRRLGLTLTPFSEWARAQDWSAALPVIRDEGSK
ncbi:MAG: hypothetical protein D6763_02755 [Alphaproteobacteria bacterium]|nr:MAG: hypothetical protein D6763_02755 [Alphaproteobacteria bacterium]